MPLLSLRSFVPSLLRSFVVAKFLRSFVPSFVRCCKTFLRSFLPFFLPSFHRSFVRLSVPSFVSSNVPKFLPSFLPSFLCSFVRSFVRQSEISFQTFVHSKPSSIPNLRLLFQTFVLHCKPSFARFRVHSFHGAFVLNLRSVIVVRSLCRARCHLRLCRLTGIVRRRHRRRSHSRSDSR